MLFDAEMRGVQLDAALEIIARLVRRINVDRTNQTFLPKRPGCLHRPNQAKQTDGGDAHARILRRRQSPAAAGWQGSRLYGPPWTVPPRTELGRWRRMSEAGPQHARHLGFSRVRILNVGC